MVWLLYLLWFPSIYLLERAFILKASTSEERSEVFDMHGRSSWEFAAQPKARHVAYFVSVIALVGAHQFQSRPNIFALISIVCFCVGFIIKWRFHYRH